MRAFTRFIYLSCVLFKGLLMGKTISKAADYTLTKDEREHFYIGLTATAASKTFTLGLPDDAVCIVVNEGATNAFTLKNVSGDTGTSIGTGKAYLLRASSTADSSKLTLLNDGT